jgi:hypothetical protein
MDRQVAVLTDKAPKPIPQFSQAVKYNGMVYCSGSIGMDPKTWKLVEGSVKDRTVYIYWLVKEVLGSLWPAPSTPQPVGRPRGSRKQPQERRQGDRVPDRHEQLRRHERGL